MALRANFSDGLDRVVRPFARAVAWTGVTPNVLTTLGIVLTATATAALILVGPVAAGWILVFGGLMDTFDGAVARIRHLSTPFGSFYDAISDRISDGLILAGIAYWTAAAGRPRLFILAAVALVAAQVTSYVRAKAESIDLECSIGILERAERAILLMAALVFHRWLLEPILWVLAVGGTVTVVQRVHHVWCQIDRDVPEELLAFARGDRAWNRAFTAAARRFFGDKNFEAALDDLEAPPAGGGPAPPTGPVGPPGEAASSAVRPGRESGPGR